MAQPFMSNGNPEPREHEELRRGHAIVVCATARGGVCRLDDWQQPAGGEEACGGSVGGQARGGRGGGSGRLLLGVHDGIAPRHAGGIERALSELDRLD